MSNNHYTGLIFLDLKMAFDTVNHNILLSKLHHYGIQGVAHSLLSSYLTNRKQSVTIYRIYSRIGHNFFLIFKKKNIGATNPLDISANRHQVGTKLKVFGYCKYRIFWLKSRYRHEL